MTSSLGPFSFLRLDARFALRCFLLGLPLLLLILFALSGSVETMAGILLISVVCTAGIGGFVWFAAALLLGVLLQLLLPFLRGRPPLRRDSGDGLTSSDLLLPRGAADSLVRYILRREAEGARESSVRSDLRRAGWGDDQVEAAVERARQLAPLEAPPVGGG